MKPKRKKGRVVPERGTKWISRIVSAGLLMPAFLWLSCIEQPLDPIAPTWDVDLTFPLADRTYTLAEIVDKDPELLHTGVGNQLLYATSLSARPTFIEDRLALTFPDTAVEFKLGPVAISAFTWSAPLDIPWLPRGYMVPVPDTTVGFADVEHTSTSFQSLTFSQGTATVTLHNNLPVAIDVTEPVSVTDESGDLIGVLHFVPSTIPPAGSRSASQDLAEKTLTSVTRVSGLRIRLHGSTTPVTIPASGDLIAVSVAASGLEARRAVLASIPPQRLTDNNENEVPLDDSTLVREVVIKSGRLDVFLSSGVDLDMGVKYRFKELFRRAGPGYVAYEDSVELPARSSQSKVIDLAGLRIASPDGSLLSSLEVVSSVILRRGSSNPVTVSEDDRVQFALSKSAPVVADSVVALLKPTWLNLDKTVPVDFGDLPTRFSGQVNIPTAVLDFSVLSTIGYPLDLFVRLGAWRGTGRDSAFLDLPGAHRVDAGGTALLRFDPTEVGRFLSSVSGKLPDSLRIMGRILLSPPDLYALKTASVGSAGRHSSLGGTLDIEVPLMLGIVNGTYKDTMDTGDKSDREDIDAVNNGKTYVELTNGLPLDVVVSLSLIDSAQRVLLPLPPSGEPVHAAAAPVDAQGNVTVPAQSSVVFELAENDIRQLKVADFLAAHFGLQTTGGSSAVRFRTNDSVRLKIWAQLSYRVNRE